MMKRYLSLIITLCMLVLTTTPAYSTLSNEAVFDWVEHKFSDLFPKSVTVKSELTHEGVHYDLRSWSGAWGIRYLGITDGGEIFGFGDFTDSELRSFGYVNDWEDEISSDTYVMETITITSPVDYFSNACTDPVTQFVIPVNINNDGMSDFIVHYWCFAIPNETWGTTVTTPTEDALVVHVSQADGTYMVANEEVFGSNHIGLGGASRKYVRGDINKDGREDFAFAMNYEDGRSGADWNTVTTQPSVLMSTGESGYKVLRLGEPEWGHSVGITNNADGTSEVYFVGFTGVGIQAFRYIDGDFIDVSDTYPADGGEWAYGVRSINDDDGITKYIVVSASVADPDAEVYTILKRGAKLFKRVDGIWTELDAFYYDADFTIDFISWNDDVGTNSVFTVNNERYIIHGFDAWHVMKGGLSGFDNDLIVGKLAAAQDQSGTYIEGEIYDSNDGVPVQMYQFFDTSGDELTLVESPIVNEEIESNFNFFDVKDITGDGYSDIITYAFSRPWELVPRTDEAGKPTIYLNDSNGSLIHININDLPDGRSNQGKQSLVYDVNGDGIVDLLLFGTAAGGSGGDIDIHFLSNYLSL